MSAKRRATSQAGPAARAAAMAFGGGMGSVPWRPWSRGPANITRRLTVPRSAATLAYYGRNMKYADPMQRMHRNTDAYYGPGRYHRRRRTYRRRYHRRGSTRYRGRGGFWGDAWKGIKKVAKVALPIAAQFLPGPLGMAARVGMQFLPQNDPYNQDEGNIKKNIN